MDWTMLLKLLGRSQGGAGLGSLAMIAALAALVPGGREEEAAQAIGDVLKGLARWRAVVPVEREGSALEGLAGLLGGALGR